MAADIPSIRFSDDQHQHLEELGLTPRQIAELENMACPVGKLFLAKPERVADMRDGLAKIRREMGQGQTSLGEMLKGKMTGARKVALLMLCDAAVRRGGYQMIERAPIPQNQLSKIFAEARAALPKQSRQRATPRPVQLIWQAIIGAHERPQPNRIHLSWSPGSAFREIVGICYEAMTGKRDVDPERAIKAFVRGKRNREARQREEIGINKELGALGVVPTAARARGRPLKTLVPLRKKI